jgi:hypothetical protein
VSVFALPLSYQPSPPGAVPYGTRRQGGAEAVLARLASGPTPGPSSRLEGPALACRGHAEAAMEAVAVGEEMNTNAKGPGEFLRAPVMWIVPLLAYGAKPSVYQWFQKELPDS